MPSIRLSWTILLLAALLHFGLCLRSALQETPTIDEFAHLPAGLAYWEHGAFGIYNKSPPLVRLWMTAPLVLGFGEQLDIPAPGKKVSGWGPWEYGTRFERANFRHYLHSFTLARVMILILSLATGLLIFIWGKQIFGIWAGLVAACGFWLSPTVLAHAHLGTTDIGATFFILLFLYAVQRSTKTRLREIIAVGVTLGLALAAKFTAILLAPGVLLWWLWRFRMRGLASAGGILLISLFVLHASYGFKGSWKKIEEFRLFSSSVDKVLRVWPASWPIPLPTYFLEGFDEQVADTEHGEFGGYLLGQWSTAGWWYYHPMAFLLKESVWTLLGLLLIPWAFWRRRQNEVLYLLMPVVLIALPLCFGNVINVGVRYLLPSYPYLFLLIGFAFESLASFAKPKARILAGVILLGWTTSALASAGNPLAYFNWIATALAPPEKLLLDSNLDWGQDLYRLKDFQSELRPGEKLKLLYFGHVSPSVYGIDFELVTSQPQKGLLAVSVQFVEGGSYIAPTPDGGFISVSADHARWLKDKTPIRKEGSIWIFDTRQE